jgi:hypothetical protein
MVKNPLVIFILLIIALFIIWIFTGGLERGKKAESAVAVLTS